MRRSCRRCARSPASIRGTAIGRSGSSCARQGHVMSADRAYRLWRQAGLQVPQRRPRRRVATSRPRPLPPTAANHVWAYDFVFDTCADGRTLKCLTVVDEFTRECLAIDVAGGIRSGRVIEVLDAARQRARRAALSALRQRARVRGDRDPPLAAARPQIETAFIDPGKPWQNGTDESFNGKFRDECLILAVVPESARSEGRHRAVAASLQRPRPRTSGKSATARPRGVCPATSGRPCIGS